MNISIKGIIAGNLAGMFVSFVLGLAAGFFLAAVFGAEARQFVTPTSIPVLMVSMLAAVVGGYVAARVAGRSELTHGVLAILAGAVLSLLSWDGAADDAPLKILQLTLLPLFGLFGGYIRLRQVTQEA